MQCSRVADDYRKIFSFISFAMAEGFLSWVKSSAWSHLFMHVYTRMKSFTTFCWRVGSVSNSMKLGDLQLPILLIKICDKNCNAGLFFPISISVIPPLTQCPTSPDFLDAFLDLCFFLILDLILKLLDVHGSQIGNWPFLYWVAWLIYPSQINVLSCPYLNIIYSHVLMFSRM